jgi:single-strand DNA-binding protein
MYHELTLIGRLGRDPEARYTKDMHESSSFSVAVNSYGEDNPVIWINVTAWREAAQFCNKHLRKGDMVYIAGTLRADKETGAPRVYSKRDGTPGAQFEINARNVIGLVYGQEKTPQNQEEQWDDDIPF